MCEPKTCCNDGVKPGNPKRRRRRTYDVISPGAYVDNEKRILLRCERAANRGNIATMESSQGGPETEFVNIVTKLITKTLEIGWCDRQNFASVLKAAIGNNIYDLLDDYLDYWVEEYNNKIVREFKLDENIEPGYQHANHAKLAPVITAAIKKFKEALLKQCKCKEKKNAKKK